MIPVIKEFSNYSAVELYKLYKEVYSSTESMSESIEEKYPDLKSFEDEMIIKGNILEAIAIVVELEEKPVAYLTIVPRNQSKLRHTADLNMGVTTIARGKGIGHQILMAGLEQAFSSPELEIVYLMVRADNIPAIRLYEKVGFEAMTVLHRDTKIDDAYFDGILMRKFVDASSAQQFTEGN